MRNLDQKLDSLFKAASRCPVEAQAIDAISERAILEGWRRGLREASGEASFLTVFRLGFRFAGAVAITVIALNFAGVWKASTYEMSLSNNEITEALLP